MTDVHNEERLAGGVPSPSPGNPGRYPNIYPGKYRIKNSATGTAFDMAWEQERDRPIHGWAAHNGTNQQWLVEATDMESLFFLRCLDSNQYAAVSAGIASRPLHGSTHPMQWTTERIGNELMLVDPMSGLAAELLDGNPGNDIPIRLGAKDANKRQQRWVFETIS